MAKTIGKYEVIRSLGSGAMGEVFLARQAAIGREVAIKTILSTVAKGEEAEDRFRREAEAAGKLNHPNLVTIFDFDKDGDLFYLVMEFVKGDDLEDLIKQRSLSHSQFLEMLAQVCDGLSHAHRHGIIHRDIKPANVRVVRDGKNLQAKVMDFGIARVEDSNLTATGIVMGTVSYMAPEYIREGHASSRSDLFAVGVMLYECLTGRKPFAGDNTTTILFKIVSDAPAPIDLDALQGISPSIRHVLDKALAKEPGDRFQTADELAKALRACKDPSWSGTLDEATAMIARHQAGLATVVGRPPSEEGTQLIQGTSLPTVVGKPAGAPPVPAQPMPKPAPQAPAHEPAKSRTGLVAGAAAALVVVAGGAWLALRPKPVASALAAAQPGVAQPPQPQAAQGTPPQAPPAQATQAPTQAPTQTPAPNALQASAKPTTSGTAPSPQSPVPSKAQPEAPRPEPAHAAPAPVAAPKPPAAEPPRPPAAPAAPKAPDVTVKTLTALLDADPRQAAIQAKPLAVADPGNAELQGLYLAALYQSRNAWDFERGLARATASGATVKRMVGASEPFRRALGAENKLRKATPGGGVLPDEVMAKILAGL